MYKATDGIILPTTIIGSLPRPHWYTENLGTRKFREAMTNARFREQYTDAVSSYLRDEEVAGLDICTDGDCRFDIDVGGHTWFSYAPRHMDGFEGFHPYRIPKVGGRPTVPPGRILHDITEARLMPEIVGPVGRGDLQYTAIWKTAQRLTKKPVKFGTITPELIAMGVKDSYYKSMKERIRAIGDALNEELTEVARAGCTAIQMEEPQVHLLAAKGLTGGELTPEYMREVFNDTVRGLRDLTEVWCHTCWGNPAQQRIFDQAQSYAPSLEELNKIEADILTFECCSTGGMDLEAIGKTITDKKIAIGVVDHHSLQVETPDEVADLIRRALDHIPAERLILCSDCGMGREGMSRRHAFYKMASIVQGTNIVRRELGLPEAECLAADPRFSLVEKEELQ